MHSSSLRGSLNAQGKKDHTSKNLVADLVRQQAHLKRQQKQILQAKIHREQPSSEERAKEFGEAKVSRGYTSSSAL